MYALAKEYPLEIEAGDRLYGTFTDNAFILRLSEPSDNSKSVTITVRDRYQITLPTKAFRMMGVREGDLVEIQQKDGALAIYPKISISAQPRRVTAPVPTASIAFEPPGLREAGKRRRGRKRNA